MKGKGNFIFFANAFIPFKGPGARTRNVKLHFSKSNTFVLIHSSCSMQIGQVIDLIVIKQTILSLDKIENDSLSPFISEIFLGNLVSEALRLAVNRTDKKNIEILACFKSNTFIQA